MGLYPLRYTSHPFVLSSLHRLLTSVHSPFTTVSDVRRCEEPYERRVIHIMFSYLPSHHIRREP